MEVEAITHALRWFSLRRDSQTTHAIILTDSVKLQQKERKKETNKQTKTKQNKNKQTNKKQKQKTKNKNKNKERKKWNGKPGLKCVNCRHPLLKTPVGVLPWTCRSEGK